MVVGQPGSGKSTFARRLGAATGLPVVHIDHIHYRSNWVERGRDEKDRLTREVHARDAWIFEGGHSRTWPERIARADTLVWLDVPVHLRLWRVTLRALYWFGHTRPDLPEGCREQLGPEFRDFIRYIWRTRATGRTKMAKLFAEAPPHVAAHRVRTRAEADALVANLAARDPASAARVKPL
jgi:adenylate kinase family enzyme